MSIAEHAPDKLYARNRGMLGMSHDQLHHFASTKESGLPQKVPRSLLNRFKPPKRGR